MSVPTIMTEVAYDESTPVMRTRVKALVKEAKNACHRPLFEDISLGLAQSSNEDKRLISMQSSSKRSKLTKSRKWEAVSSTFCGPCFFPQKTSDLPYIILYPLQILEDATMLLPFTMPQEHGIISKCAAIYLLGFLNPNSTGCEFAALRSTASDTTESFFDMELEERLENTSRFFHANEFGQINVCTDVNRERAFQTFLKKGLAPFLRGRAAHPNNTDLLHLLAMAISPQVTAHAIDNIVAPFEEKQIPAWMQTRRLMGCLHAHSFPLHYAHRFLLVEIVANQVVLPNTDSPQMLAGAVPHLLAAMHTFATHTARNVADAHTAHIGLVRIATQIGQEWIVREVFYILLAHTLDDRNRCKCPLFCPHAARGSLLRNCISIFNISRHHANDAFTGQAFMALNASIEEHMEPWMTESSDEPQGACLLSALLHAAEALFVFMEGDSKIEKIGLLEMCIQLLHHPDIKIRNSASSLLSVALLYIPSSDTNRLMPTLLESIKVALDCQFKDYSVTTVDKSLFAVIAVSARSSAGLASSLLSYVMKQRCRSWKSDNIELDATIANGVSRMISKMACSNPGIAFRQAESIRSLLQGEASETAKQQLVAALLATRQAYTFGRDDKATHDVIDAYVRGSKFHWMDFLMARHALVTGNFSVAKTIYDGLLSRVSGESCFLWISSLSKVAEAESYLLDKGGKGIPLASTLIQSAISYLELLNSQGDGNLDFQIAFLRLRLDFLDVSAATRLICRETRLSGTVPKDATRVGLHLVNTLKSWGALATRFQSLYRRHGLVMCPQSRTAIRTLQSICRQCASAGFHILSEAIAQKNKLNANVTGPKGDRMHPTIRLIQKVNVSVFSDIDKSVEPAVRVTVLIELLEGVHRSPIPFPRSFTFPKSFPKATLRVSLDPSQKFLTLGQEELNIEGLPMIVDSTAIYPGTHLAVVASGSVPSMLTRVSPNLSQLLLWVRIRFVSSLHDGYVVDDDDDTLTADPSNVKLIQDSGPIEIHHLSTSNHFVVLFELPQINSVGLYTVDCRLGCRDTGFREWELPHDRPGSAILLRVTRRLDPTH